MHLLRGYTEHGGQTANRPKGRDHLPILYARQSGHRDPGALCYLPLRHHSLLA